MNKLLQVVPSSSPTLREQAVSYGISKVDKPAAQSFALAVFAGGFIALAFVFYLTVTTGAVDASWGLTRLAGGVAFSLGLMLVVVCGAELFTSTILSSVAWFGGLLSTKRLLACWGRVFIGNLVGAALVLGLVVMAKMHDLDGGAWGINALQVAQHKLHHTWWQAFSLGVLCNLLVCLGVWMSFSSKDSMGKSFLLILPVAMFVSSGFEHSVANLFMVPLGIALQILAERGIFVADQLVASEFSDLTFSHFFLNNLIPVVLGNIVGGALLVGLGCQFTRTTGFAKTTSFISGETKMTQSTITNKTVAELYNAKLVTLNADTGIYQAIRVLVDNHVPCAPVVDQQNRLLGVLSEQDILRQLWSEEFSTQLTLRVRDMMQTEVITVAPTDRLDALIEFMAVDRDKLFPVNEAGILTGPYLSYEERLKLAVSTKPSNYPVIENNNVVGMLFRHDLLCFINSEFAPRIEKRDAAAA